MMEGFDFIGFGAVTVLCYLCGEIIKCTKLDKKWIPALCGVFGGTLGTLAFFFLPGFPAANALSAAAEGIVSGLAATGANQVYKQMSKQESEVG